MHIETKSTEITKTQNMMKRVLKRQYLSPRVRDARVEAEGILCGSIVPQPEVDELQNMSGSSEQSYFEL